MLSLNRIFLFWVLLFFSTNAMIYSSPMSVILSKFNDSKEFVVATFKNVQSLISGGNSKLSETISFISKKKKIFTNWVVEQVEKLEDNGSLWLQLLFAFLAGLSVSFTPCIYPLIPITIGILSSRGHISHRRQMARALFYVLGVSVVFAALGVLCAQFGWIFGTLAGNRWVILLTVAFFTFLALSMLDVFEIDYSMVQVQTPHVSSIFSAFLYGAVTGIIASPCSTPALLSLLGFVTEKNSPMLGFLLLCSFAVGMTFLIVLFSTFSNLLMLMPKPGQWMVDVRHFLGFGILFLCVDFLSSPSVISANWQKYILLALLWSAVALYYLFGSKQDSVSKLIIAHRDREAAGDVNLQRRITFSEFISLSFFVKKTFAIVAMSFAIYYFGKTYLSYKHTKLVSVLIKLLK